MSWLGKMLGGGLGFVFGGPLGAVFGAVLGHHALDSGQNLSVQENRQSLFFLATFSMLGKLSKADGQVSSEEIRVVEELMERNLRLSAQARRRRRYTRGRVPRADGRQGAARRCRGLRRRRQQSLLRVPLRGREGPARVPGRRVPRARPGLRLQGLDRRLRARGAARGDGGRPARGG